MKILKKLSCLLFLFLMGNRLSAQTGAAVGCRDSSFHIRHYSVNNSFSAYRQITTRNGGRIIIGQVLGTTNTVAMIARVNKMQNIEWSRTITLPAAYTSLNLYAVEEAANENIAVSGIVTENTGSHFYYAIFSASGNLLKQEIPQFPNANGSYKGVHTICKQSADSLLFLFYSNEFITGKEGLCMLSCDNTGNAGWCRILGIPFTYFSICFTAATVSGNRLNLYGSGFSTLSCNNYNVSGMFTSLQYDLAGNQVIYHKTYCVPYTGSPINYSVPTINQSINYLPQRVFFLRNGNIAMVRPYTGVTTTSPYSPIPMFISYFDPSFNLIRSEFLQSKISFKTTTIQDILIDSDGVKHISFSDFNNKAVYFAVADTSDKFLLQKKLPLPDFTVNNTDTRFQKIEPGMFTGFTTQNITGSRTYLDYVQVRKEDTADACFGLDTSFLSFMPVPATPNISSNSILSYAAIMSHLPINCQVADFPMMREDICIVLSPPLSFTIGNDTTYCPGKTYTLKAPGGLREYKWQDGSTDSIFIAAAPGTYYVTATDFCNHIYHDTMEIKPADFLLSAGTDTVICKSESIVLKATPGFYDYLWSPAYHISNTSGMSVTVFPDVTTAYTVQAEKFSGCILTDTVVVSTKNCPKKFYIPNAFSPNGDGKNEIFKPIITGTLVYYEFTIYNRWGQQIFKTSDRNEGWNGSIKGNYQNTNVFSWMCKYRFLDEQPQISKGIVTLIR